MATHVVCPLCGKSSSLKSFPSGSGTDLALQSFRGLGRGRGFEAVPGGSGLADERLARAVHEKVVAILRTLEPRGLGNTATTSSYTNSEHEHVSERIASLERELAHETASRQFAETELASLEKELAEEKQSRDRALARVAVLSRQLENACKTEDQLLTSSRDTIASLRHLGGQLHGVPFAAASLAPVVRDVKQMIDLVHELRAASLVKSATARDVAATR